MKILGFDTSSRVLCLGLCDGDKVYEYNLELGTKISELLVPTIKRILDNLNWDINDIDYCAAGIGPGSFTGVRVGLSAIKAISWSLNKPVIGVASLDILARNVRDDHALIIPVIDARRGLVYAAIYKKEGSLIKRLTGYMLVSPQELSLQIKNKISVRLLKDSVILGDGLNICAKDYSAGFKGIRILDQDYWRLEGRKLIELAKIALEDKKYRGAFRIKPLYLYPKECQIRKDSG